MKMLAKENIGLCNLFPSKAVYKGEGKIWGNCAILQQIGREYIDNLAKLCYNNTNGRRSPLKSTKNIVCERRGAL